MAFGGSDPRIYMRQQIKGINREWMEQDVIKKLAKINTLGYAWDTATTKLKKSGPFGFAFETPWIHAIGSHKHNCGMDHNVIFNLFEIITPKCQRCFKVCMGLPNFASLMRMTEIQEELPPTIPCKCGIEIRDYTPKHYGAYFYTTSLEEGRDRYEFIKQIVIDNMENGKEIAKGIILKRGCTEFEMIKGPSPYWHNTEKEMEMLELIDGYVIDRLNPPDQSKMAKNFVRQNWIKWAHSNGDMSYLPWNGGVNLFPDYVKYHEGDIETIKKEMNMAVKSLNPTPPIHPLDMDIVKYSPEVIGDLDELT